MMQLLSLVAFACLVSCTVAATCHVSNGSSCQPQVVSASSACYTCDNGMVDAGSCERSYTPWVYSCDDRETACQSAGGMFTWCYGDSCNSCSPRYRALPLQAWANKSVAFVTAHPDDLEALAGATVAALTKQVSSSASALCVRC